MQQKFSTSSFRSGQSAAGPNQAKSASILSSTSLLNLFCVDAESDEDDLISVQLILSAFANRSACATSLSFEVHEISAIIESELPSATSFTDRTVPLIAAQLFLMQCCPITVQM